MKYPKLRELKEALRSLFSRPATTKFPAVAHIPLGRFRGKPQPSDKGCVACMACARVCPANSIEVIEEGKMRRVIWHHDICIFCGQCEAVCITGEGVKLGKEFDLAGFDRSKMSDLVEKELVFCQRCGEAITTKAHLNWLFNRLGEKAYSNPTLMLSAEDKLVPTEKIPGKDFIQRQDLIRILGPRCRHEVLVKDLLGK